MANSDVRDLVSRTITILQVTTEHYDAIDDDESLCETFHQAGRGLILIHRTLEAAQTHLSRDDLACDVQKALSPLKACKRNAELAETIFKTIALASETSRFNEYKAATRGWGNRVEVLVINMMEALCHLADDVPIQIAGEKKAKTLRDAINKLSDMGPSIPNEESGNIWAHYGSGNLITGEIRNITRGQGPQFPGATFTGTVNFSRDS
jgi:hypothetical protein